MMIPKNTLLMLAMLTLALGAVAGWTLSESFEGQLVEDAQAKMQTTGTTDTQDKQASEERVEPGPKGPVQRASKDKQGENDHRDEVHLTQEQRDKLNIDLARAGQGSAKALVEAPATARFDPDRMTNVGPRLTAKVVEVTKDLGDKVDEGDTVAILDSVALGKAKGRYLAAKARRDVAYADYQRERKLNEQDIASEAEMLEAKGDYLQAKADLNAVQEELRLYGLSAQAIKDISAGGEEPLSRYRLTAPQAGVVQRRDLTPGQTLSANETPVHIVDNSRMWVMADVFENALPRLETGQRARFTVRALPEARYAGKVDWISRDLDEQTRTVRVRAVVDNADGRLRAGMFGTAAIQTESDAKTALVPVDAVQTLSDHKGDREVVFVPGKEDGAFRAVPVETGEEGGGRIEIRSGLEPNDRVVVAGAFDLKAALTAGGRSAAHSH